MRVAIVHDWLNQRGGAEDVLERMQALYPAAPVFTSIYAPETMPAAYRQWDIRTAFTNRLPGIHRRHQPYLLLYPLAFAGFNLAGHNVILSNKSGFCMEVRKPAGALHVCYCLTPTRYVWSLEDYAAREPIPAGMLAALRLLVPWLQRRERAAARSVDHFLAISSAVQQRIALHYGRESTVLHPPVETARFAPMAAPGDYFLVVSRLVPYKRIDLAVRACTSLQLPLVVAGEGRDLQRLQQMAGPTIKFIGRVPAAGLPDLLAGCRAFIFPGLEDFGIAPVQALASGRPVIAFAGGGALDYVDAQHTGCLFQEQTVEALEAALRSIRPQDYEPAALQRFALQFDVSVFDERLRAFIAKHAPA